MRRRENQNPPESMPVFDRYVTPEPMPGSASVQPGFDEGMRYEQAAPRQPQQVSTEAALARLVEMKAQQKRQVDRYELVMRERLLASRMPLARLTADDVSRIEANYQRAKREITGRSPAAITGGGRPPATKDRGRNSGNFNSDNSGRTTTGRNSHSQTTTENGFSFRKIKEGLLQRKRTSAAVLIGVMIASATVAFGVTRSGEQGGEVADALQAQPRSKELKNDTFAGGTTLATSNPTTNDGVEVHVPVELQDAGHKAYIEIPLKQIKMGSVAIKANGARINGKDPAVWAHLVKDTYVVDRSAIDLTVDPWIRRVAANETQATSPVGTQLLPSAVGLQLIVDGKPADHKKYPLSTKGTQQLASIVEIKDPKKPQAMFSNDFMNTLVAKVEYATILALEDPNQCPTVSQAIDKADLANFSIQKSVSANKVIINERTSYGKASDNYALNKDVKADVASDAFTLNKFSISCDAEPVMPKQDSKAPAPTKSASATTKK